MLFKSHHESLEILIRFNLFGWAFQWHFFFTKKEKRQLTGICLWSVKRLFGKHLWGAFNPRKTYSRDIWENKNQGFQIKKKRYKNNKQSQGTNAVWSHIEVGWFLPVITFAMHKCIDAPVEQSILGFEPHNPEWARFIMLSTASVRFWTSTQFNIFFCWIAFSAPFSPGQPQHIRQISTTSAN